MCREAKKAENSGNIEIIEKWITCLTESCPVQTKICVPSSYAFSQNFLCGFCAANDKIKIERNYSAAVTNSIKNEQRTRATLFAEVQREQTGKDAKKLNLVVKGTQQSPSKSEAALAQEFAKKLNITISVNDVECKRIGTLNTSTGCQLLLKFEEPLKRKEFLRKSGKLRDGPDLSNV